MVIEGMGRGFEAAHWVRLHTEPGLEIWADPEPRRSAFTANAVITAQPHTGDFRQAAAFDIQEFPHGQVIDHEQFTNAGLAGERHLISYTAPGGFEVTAEHLRLDTGGEMLTLTLTCFTPDYLDLHPTFDEIIASFLGVDTAGERL